MNRNKKTNNKYAKRRRNLKIIVFILLLIIIKLIFFGKEQNVNNVPKLIIGSEVISLQNDIFVDSLQNVYMSFDDVKKIYDENIFYDEINKRIITTYNKHIAILDLDKKNAIINDAEIELKGSLQYFNDKLYLPYSDLEIVYDFEYSYADDTNIVMVDSISKSKNVATVLKKTKVKNKTGLFSKKLATLNPEDSVVVLGKEDNQLKIRTENGIIGYVKEKKISELNELRQDMDDKKIENINVLKKYSSLDSEYEAFEVSNNKNNVVIPNYFVITDDKSVDLTVSTKNEKYQKYNEWTKNNNISIWATLKSNIEVSDCMLTYEDRKELIDSIYKELVQNKFKTLNINFEKINDINSFYRFLIEITPKLKESGINTVVTYNSVMNKDKVQKIVDFVIEGE